MKRVKFWVYALGGALAAVGAGGLAPDSSTSLGLTPMPASVTNWIPSLLSSSAELRFRVAAVPFSAPSLGCLIIGVLNNGLFILTFSPFWQLVIKGLVIIVIAVAIDQMGIERRMSRTISVTLLPVVWPSSWPKPIR